MKNENLDVLADTLLRLEAELGALSNLQKKLDEGHAHIASAEDSLKKEAESQLQSIREQIEYLKSAVSSMESVTKQTKLTSDELIALTKAIDHIKFPERLDRIAAVINAQAELLKGIKSEHAEHLSQIRSGIDSMGVIISTQATAISTLQAATTRELGFVHEEIKACQESIDDGFSENEKFFEKMKSRMNILGGCLVAVLVLQAICIWFLISKWHP